MKHFLLPEGVTPVKANLHAHTTVSDGNLTPAEVKAAYLSRGYGAVAFTDHEALVTHDDLTDEHFIALNGYETAVKPVQVGTYPFLPVHHINFIKKKPHDDVQFCFFPENFTPGACREQIPFVHYVGEKCRYAYTPEFIRHLIRTAHENGCLVHYNHPRWSLQSSADILPFAEFDGLEIMNTECRFHGDFNPDVYDELCRQGFRGYAVGGDDNHNENGASDASFGGATYIYAKSFTYEGLTDALAAGDVVTSSGPVIREMYIEDGQLCIRTSPAKAIVLSSFGRHTRRVFGEGGYIDTAVFPIESVKLGSYFRVSVEDDKGNFAYTRVYDKSEWEKDL